jgi:hypothetical protein
MMILSTPLIPAKAGTQIFGRSGQTGFVQAAIPRTGAPQKHWVPAFAGISGSKVEGLFA